MKKFNKIFLVLFLGILFLGFFTINGKSQFADLNYEFQRNILLEETEIVFDDSFNLRDSGFYNGTYPATFSFTNDTIGNVPLGWISNNDIGCSTSIIALQSGHSKVLKIIDNSTIGSAVIVQTFTEGAQISGIVEFWMETFDITKRTFFQIRGGGLRAVYVGIRDSQFQYYDGTYKAVGVTPINSIKSYHQIVFDSTTDTYDWYINQVLAVDDADFENVRDSLDDVYITTSGSTDELITYFDAIGYSFDINSTIFDDFTSETLGQEPSLWTSDNGVDCTTLVSNTLGDKSLELLDSFELDFEIFDDFSSETLGQEPSLWTSDNGVGCTTLVSNTLGDKSLELFDSDTSGFGNISREITSQEWNNEMRMSVAVDETDFAEGNILFYEGSTNVVHLSITGDDLYYRHSGGFSLIRENFITDNTFFLLGIIFNHATDTIDVYINEVQYGNDLEYYNDVSTDIDKIELITSQEIAFTRSFFIDNILFVVSYPDASEFCNISREITSNEWANEISMNVAVDETDFSDNSILFYEGSTNVVHLSITGDDLYYRHSGGFSVIRSNFITDNTFFLLGIVFNHTTDTIDVYIDYEQYGNDLEYYNNVSTDIDKIELTTSQEIEFTRTFFIDNILFVFERYYIIGDNKFSFFELDGFQEIDKFEFFAEGVNNDFETGDKDPNGWKMYEFDDGFFAMGVDPFETNDGTVLSLLTDTTDATWLTRENLNITTNFFEVSLEWLVLTETGNSGWFNLTLFDDLDVITELGVILSTGALYGGYNELRNDIAVEVNYTFVLKVNYQFDTVLFDYYIDNVLIETYMYPTTTLGLNSLDHIFITTTSGGGASLVVIDSVGLYSEGVSQSTDLAYSVQDLNISTWLGTEYNLFSVNASGLLHFSSITGSYEIGESLGIIHTFKQYNNTLILTNLYDTSLDVSNPSLLTYYSGNQLKGTDSVLIEGVKLVEGINEYNLIFTHTGVDIDESYFYTDDSNRLQFIYNADDSGLEFIQATFNIIDVSTNDSTIGWHSNKAGDAYGYLRINYTDDTSNIYNLPSISTTRKIILPQGKIIGQIIILITDNSFSTISGLTTGYISNISIEYLPDIIVSVITLNLVSIIIPLIMIIIPSIAIGTKSNRNIIIPIFILMSIICVMTSIIPYWLFFIIIISSSLFIFTRRHKGVIQ